MAKDTYYFSHDYNARNDRKIAALVKDHKSSGYGVYWATCEMMHEESGSIEFDELTINSLAKDMNEEAEFISKILNDCVEKYRLFTKQTKQNEAENFASLLQSNRIIRNLDSKKEKKEIKAKAGALGGIKSGESRNKQKELKQNEAERSTASQNEPNKIKENKSKVNNKGFNTMPVLSDFNGLPDQYKTSAYEILYITKRIKISEADILSMWGVFKSQRLTGKNHYPNEEKVYSHFVDWIKTKDFKDNSQKTGMVM
jgi:hypothetical protein